MEEALRRLVSFKTITGNVGEVGRALDWVQKQIEPHLFVRRLASNGFSSLFATSRRSAKKPRILLAAHIDVVPAAPEAFMPKRVGKKLYGRGTFDMKFAIACYLRLIKEISHEMRRYDVGIMITSDEEIGGFDGVASLLKKGLSGQMVLLPDGGNTNWRIEEGAKGVLHLRVMAPGKSAHASRPWVGKNPFPPLMAFLSDLQKQFPSEPCGDRQHYHDTLTIGRIAGGEAVNQVPSSASADIDIRHIPETSKRSLLSMIRSIQKQHSGIRVHELVSGPAYTHDLALLPYARFRELARDIAGVRVAPAFSHGSSDARFFAEQKIPVLLIQPNGGGHHTDTEWIDLSDMERYYAVVRQWVEELGRD